MLQKVELEKYFVSTGEMSDIVKAKEEKEAARNLYTAREGTKLVKKLSVIASGKTATITRRWKGAMRLLKNCSLVHHNEKSAYITERSFLLNVYLKN